MRAISFGVTAENIDAVLISLAFVELDIVVSLFFRVFLFLILASFDKLCSMLTSRFFHPVKFGAYSVGSDIYSLDFVATLVLKVASSKAEIKASGPSCS